MATRKESEISGPLWRVDNPDSGQNVAISCVSRSESHLGRKLLERPAGLGSHEGVDHVLEGGRHEEILLLETELLASPVVVVGVENLPFDMQ